MGQYLPYAGTNSIQEVALSIQLQNEFIPRILASAHQKLQTDLKDIFPRIDLIQQIPEIVVRDGQLTPVENAAKLKGFELFNVKADGTPSCILRVLENTVTINFFEYNDWYSIFSKCSHWMHDVIGSLTQIPNSIEGYNLRYVDRYTYDGPITEPCAELLFQRNNSYISSQCFEVGPLWHCYSGWYEDHDENRVLNQLEVKSKVVEKVSTIIIDHNLYYRLRKSVHINELVEQTLSNDNTQFRDSFNFLHERNSQILKAMLLPSMIEKIGLSNATIDD